jgi:hypothetical protein
MELIFKKKKVKDLKFADLFMEFEDGQIYHCLEQPEIDHHGGHYFIWYEDLKTKTGLANIQPMDKEIYIHEHNEEFHETGELLVPFDIPPHVRVSQN